MEKIKYVADRIEDGKIAVLVNSSDGSEIQIDINVFPEKISENDIVYLTFEKGVIKNVIPDKPKTKLKKAEMKRKIKLLFDKK